MKTASADRANLWAAPQWPGIALMTVEYKRQRFRPHTHDAFIVCAVEEGVCALDVSGQRRRIGKGMFSLIDPGAVHTGATASDTLGYRVAYLDRARAERIYGLTPGEPVTIEFHRGSPLDRRLAADFGEVHRASEKAAGPAELRDLECVLKTILTRWAVPVPRASALPSEPLSRARLRLESSFRRNVSLAELAGEARMSPYHFLRSFRDAFGLPPHAWLNQHRVERAKDLLGTPAPLAEIAYFLGFSDQSHFNSHFKSIVGLTPGRYRRMRRDLPQ